MLQVGCFCMFFFTIQIQIISFCFCLRPNLLLRWFLHGNQPFSLVSLVVLVYGAFLREIQRRVWLSCGWVVWQLKCCSVKVLRLFKRKEGGRAARHNNAGRSLGWSECHLVEEHAEICWRCFTFFTCFIWHVEPLTHSKLEDGLPQSTHRRNESAYLVLAVLLSLWIGQPVEQKESL